VTDEERVDVALANDLFFAALWGRWQEFRQWRVQPDCRDEDWAFDKFQEDLLDQFMAWVVNNSEQLSEESR